MKYLLIALGILLVVGGVGVYFFYPALTKSQHPTEITSFEECQAAGYLVVDTKPRECHTKAQQVFVEEYNGVLLQDVIVATAPEANAVITSPFKVEGKAIGNWYLNNQLTAILQDADGKVLVTKQLNALSTTQTDDFVPFVAAIDFNAADAGTPKGRLLIQKTNTSYTTGESGPLVIPVKFK
jgi:hypothetical protein